jgi:hypothetical protein
LQTSSGHKLALISTFTPLAHHSKPLVETFLRKMSLRTFREFQQPSKLAFPNHFFIILKNNHVNEWILNPFSPK